MNYSHKFNKICPCRTNRKMSKGSKVVILHGFVRMNQKGLFTLKVPPLSFFIHLLHSLPFSHFYHPFTRTSVTPCVLLSPSFHELHTSLSLRPPRHFPLSKSYNSCHIKSEKTWYQKLRLNPKFTIQLSYSIVKKRWKLWKKLSWTFKKLSEILEKTL